MKAATVSPNGKHVTVSQGDGKTSLWSVAPGRMLTAWAAEHYSAVFSPNSRRLIHGMADYSATVRDAESGEIVSELRGHDGALKTYCFGPDSKTVATGSYDQTARIWETETGRQIAELRGHTYVILKVAFTSGKANCSSPAPVIIVRASGKLRRSARSLICVDIAMKLARSPLVPMPGRS